MSKTQIPQTSAVRSPEDHKEKHGTPFRIETSKGVIEATKVGELDFSVLLQLMQLSEVEGIPVLLENGLDDDNRARLLSLPSQEAMEVMQSWQKEGNPTLPES